MARTSQDITDAELAVLQALWELGSATVRELVEKLYSENTLSLNATVQKLLERLEAKKCLKRNRNFWPHQFTAMITRDDLIERQLKSTSEKLCDGELQPLLTCLVKTRSLSAEDRKSLRSLLDELDRKQE